MQQMRLPSTMMLRPLFNSGLAIVAVFALTAQEPSGATNPDELVRAAANAPKHVSYVGQLQSTRWGVSNAISTIRRVEHKSPDATRDTYLAPPSLYGSYYVTRGSTTSRFDVAHERVVITQNQAAENQVAFNDNVALLFANYHAVAGPDETVASRPSTTISLINRHTGERVMRLWIDKQTRIVLAKESYHSDGSLATRMKFDEIRYTSDIPDTTFTTKLPAGFTSVQGRNFGEPSTDIGNVIRGAGFTPVGPKFLPEGFSIISADVTEVKGIKSLHLLYSDGLRNLSLFENGSNASADFGALKPTTTTFEKHDAQYVKDGPTTLLAWHEHHLAFTLVGDLELKELVDIAVSVVP
jgi:negative regulator of sigma E activity